MNKEIERMKQRREDSKKNIVSNKKKIKEMYWDIMEDSLNKFIEEFEKGSNLIVLTDTYRWILGKEKNYIPLLIEELRYIWEEKFDMVFASFEYKEVKSSMSFPSDRFYISIEVEWGYTQQISLDARYQSPQTVSVRAKKNSIVPELNKDVKNKYNETLKED